jgi:hypothetical protein
MKKNMQVLRKVLSESYPFSDFSNTKTEKQLALSETFFFTSCCCYRDLTERLSEKISQMKNAAASTITLYPPHETQDKNPTKKEKEGKKKKKEAPTPPKKILSNLEKKKKAPDRIPNI